MIKHVLAFDFGASSGRAMLTSYEDGKIQMEEIHRFSNDTVIVGKTMHWDILRLWFEIKQGIAKALVKGKIDAIGIDTWGVDFALIDSNGDLISNPVHYRDSRTEGMPEEVFSKLSSHELYTHTGTQTMRINTLYQLYYLAKYRPDLIECTSKMLFIPDYFAYLLTGVCRAEATIASTSNFFDPYKKTWDTDLLDRLGIPTRILAPIIRPGEVYGSLNADLCAEFGCEPIPVVAVCTHDTASAVAAAPAQGDFAYISCGTWSLFGTELKDPCITFASESANYTNEGGYDGTIRFLKNIMGLWLIQESRRQWIKEGAVVSYADLEREALASKPMQSFIDVDAPEFARAGDLPSRVKRFCEVTGQHVPQTRGEIMRTIYESIAMKYRTNYEQLCSLTGIRYSHIHMLGGGIKDTLLCRLTANSTGAQVLAGPIEATAMGNAAVTLISLGEIENLAQARKAIGNSIELKIYNPENDGSWDSEYERYCSILGRTAEK